MSSKELTFIPIEPEDFNEKTHVLFGDNMEPLTLKEIAESGDSFGCPTCKKPRRIMWRTASEFMGITILPMKMAWCKCPHTTKAGQFNE